VVKLWWKRGEKRHQKGGEMYATFLKFIFQPGSEVARAVAECVAD
jgi:hypothetical protein